MPLPLIIAGVAGALGVGGHMMAKETNREARKVSARAQSTYDDAKLLLEIAKNNADEALLAFGYAKKNVLEGSVEQYLRAIERIRDTKFDVMGDGKFEIDREGALELRKMSDIYSSAFSSGAAGAAAGVLIGLAASGSYSIVAGGMSLAGACLVTGDVAGAAAIAGSSLSLGLSFTPLAVIAAPIVLFTGMSANANAGENLEKAEMMLARAKKAAEEMKISQTMCDAIAKRSDMFRVLLSELDEIFAPLAAEFDDMTEKKMKKLGGEKLGSKDFDMEEKKLTAAVLSLTGAVKAVLDVPLLEKEGTLRDDESQKVYDKVRADYNGKLEKGIIPKRPKRSKMFCGGCGNEIMRDSKFCNYCGKKNTYMEV